MRSAAFGKTQIFGILKRCGKQCVDARSIPWFFLASAAATGMKAATRNDRRIIIQPPQAHSVSFAEKTDRKMNAFNSATFTDLFRLRNTFDFHGAPVSIPANFRCGL